MIDSHVHIGQFYQRYITPKQLSSLMKKVDVDHYAVSSTTICENRYQKTLDELNHLIELDFNKVLPVLWITPHMLKDDKESLFIDSGIQWRCIKIHPGLNPDFWQKETAVMDYVVEIASDLNLPILIHTGMNYECHAFSFKNIITRHNNQLFILAHGRPTAQAKVLAKLHNNVFVDSSFMPVSDMRRFIEAHLSHKLLWGTDMCIPLYYSPELNLVTYYKSKLNAFREICSAEQFDQVTYKNAEILFNINEL